LYTSFFRFVANHTFDRLMDSLLVASPRWHSMQRRKTFYRVTWYIKLVSKSNASAANNQCYHTLDRMNVKHWARLI